MRIWYQLRLCNGDCMSVLTVQKIVPRTLSQINIASGTSLGLSDSAFGGIRGTPVQMSVARTDTRTTFTSPNNGQVEIPQTAVTITPKFTGSLIVLKWMCTGEIHQDNGFRILKNGTLFKTTTQTNERWGSCRFLLGMIETNHLLCQTGILMHLIMM